MSLVEILSASVLVIGVSLVLLASVGLQRFESVFARIHPATKATTLGVVFLAVGAALRMDDIGDVVKLLLVAGLQLVTAPIAAHMVGRAAYRAGTELSPRTQVDELAATRSDQVDQEGRFP
ncbi:MAG TPA: monovalent cation/H(+) antiporter subunit G [Egibacteraceae bacterium]|nr:monovalent cation/H(+) antiporter subunit G [Egibacteraceae bacterium]